LLLIEIIFSLHLLTLSLLLFCFDAASLKACATFSLHCFKIELDQFILIAAAFVSLSLEKSYTGCCACTT
jgi:hypothetical protein